ncbi:uncharacterized protein BT62DRAFT_934690 [Guyanagaster necrorhizus]|uniref:Uncharacterized protein n=1 Tax=Guyanagaster necrorhizus TaxID=856835 RepID=A0A9P7VPN5_9AGAR|nr:uncharacterized protein BT62DRAFT_934690 [Guyanagaster necrorhizus MCA 3950]KAG7443741.1 hypothetical protein BT62DRAFT_934690 [Guyanagaster necrorhizus MCA 3950]
MHKHPEEITSASINVFRRALYAQLWVIACRKAPVIRSVGSPSKFMGSSSLLLPCSSVC